MSAAAQPSLFDAPATRGSSRRSDPATSREAGRSVSGQVLRVQQTDVLRAVRRLSMWQDDCTPYEVWHHLETNFTRRPDGTPVQPIKENVIAKRLGELRDLGMVRLTGETRPGSSHRNQQVFEVTAKGREVAA